MIGYISLNATGKSIRVAINFIATIPVLLICHVKRNFSGDEFLRTVPKLTKHKETRHVHVSFLVLKLRKRIVQKKRDVIFKRIP